MIVVLLGFTPDAALR